MSLNKTRVAIDVACTESIALDLVEASVPLAVTHALTLTDGTGAGQADLIFHDRRTLAASANEDIDLNGVLTKLGQTVNFARIRAVVVLASSENTNDVQVTRPSANGVPLFMAAGDGIALRPGEAFAWLGGAADATGKVVTAGTADLLNVANSGAGSSVTYDVIIIGCSA